MRPLKLLIIVCSLWVSVSSQTVKKEIIEDFQKLQNQTAIHEIYEKYKNGTDPFFEYFQENEGRILNDMEVTPEYEELMQLIRPFYDEPGKLSHQPLGKLEILWMVTSQVPSRRVSSKLNQMVEEIMNILPKHELQQLNEKKMNESKLFRDFVGLLTSQELRDALDKLGRTPSLQEYFIKLAKLGYNNYKWLELYKQCLGIYSENDG